MRYFFSSQNRSLLLLLISILIVSCNKHKEFITFSADSENPMIQFAINEIDSALDEKTSGIRPNIILRLDKTRSDILAEGFYIIRNNNRIIINAIDEEGLLYGGLELAEQIKLFGTKGIEETLQNPYFALRGTKFNIPLDARTPSYSDASDAGQKNIPEMWSMEFWMEYIDNLARYRYNFISLWNLHPFPSMVEVPGYENIALNDVHRSTIEWEENYSLNGIGLASPDIIASPEIVKQLSIRDKMEFWREVMSYAKSRNIDFYIVTWNIFINGTEGKYGITDRAENPVTTDYFRKSVEQMFLTYPDLAGIGLTTGENMYDYNLSEKEEWAYSTYGKGIMDAALKFPERKFTLIHRQHMAGAGHILEQFSPVTEYDNVDFLFSFKYAQAHALSTVEQPFHERFADEIQGKAKTIWTLRNDDNYYFRWGAPGFVRQFLKNIPYDVSKGFYYGSDQWIWGREFLMKDATEPRQIEIVKHWYHWMMWGRLGYNPDMSDKRFEEILQHRYPEVEGKLLFTAWEAASLTYPVTTAFHWGPLDFHWYIEACQGREGHFQNKIPFHDVERFINLPPHPKSGFQSIPDYVKMITLNDSSTLQSPFEVANKLNEQSDHALKSIQGVDPKDNEELKITLNDIRSMAYLGKYYSRKITGATCLALYRQTQDKGDQEEAVSQLKDALNYWNLYVETAKKQNINPIWTNRVGYVDWAKTTTWVERDIRIAEQD